MLTERDYMRCALWMIERHGRSALRRAELRATELDEQGDSGGCHTWTEVAARIRKILAAAKNPPEPKA